MKYVLAVLSLLVLISTASAQRIEPAAPQSLGELVASGSNDLVVTGTVVSAVDSVRGFAGGCGFANLSAQNVTEIDLRVESVIYGVAEDSLIHVTIIDQNFGELPGKQVLVWAYRSCPDAWRLRGYMGVIEDGMITHGNNRPIFRYPDGQHARVPLESVVNPSPAKQAHSSSVYNQVERIALVRVASIDSWSSAGGAYHVDGLRWLAGSGTMPKLITFPCLPRCYPSIVQGDTLVVPVRVSDTDSTLTLNVCPSVLRTKNGFAPGLGVTVTAVDQVLMSIGHTRWLRSYRQPEVK